MGLAHIRNNCLRASQVSPSTFNLDLLPERHRHLVTRRLVVRQNNGRQTPESVIWRFDLRILMHEYTVKIYIEELREDGLLFLSRPPLNASL